MKKIVYINCCIRKEESRTEKIASPIIDEVRKKAEVIEINLRDFELIPFNHKTLTAKMKGEFNEEYYKYSKMVADSDGLIIASPFWDMSFPAILKTFLEAISLFDVMFVSDNEKCNGIAKCPFMMLITTRGMNISIGDHLEQATPYLKALCWLWGIKDFYCVDAKNFDYLKEEEVENGIQKSIKDGITLIEKII